MNLGSELASGRQCGPVVCTLALRFGDLGFKTRSDHSLNLFLIVPGSTSQLHLGFLTVVVCSVVSLIVFHWP